MIMDMSHSIGSCYGTQPSILNSITSSDINFVLWQRNLSNFLDSWSSEIRWERTEILEGEFDRPSLENFEEDLYNELKWWRTREPDVTRWIAEDMCSNIKYFMNATNASEVFVRIEPVADDMCHFFHIDNNLLRMLCTYVGQGTLWLPNDKVERKFLGSGNNDNIVLDPLAIYHAPQLDVLILKGERYPENRIGGAVHRSPPIAKNEKRLLLKVDFLS